MHTFTSFDAALTWARTYARDHMHAFHAWRVIQRERNVFAVAIVSRNTGRVSHFA